MNFLCLDFINSRWYITHKPFHDPMDSQNWLEKISANYGLPEICLVKNIDDLKTFRELLFHALFGLCVEHKIEPNYIQKINEALTNGHVQTVLISKGDGYCLQVHHHSDDLTWVMYQIALSFSELITKYPLENLKKCENPDCDWIFYDDSKSHTRKWCDNRCASLMKVRKFRAKGTEK